MAWARVSATSAARLVYAEMGATGQVARLADENPMLRMTAMEL